MRAESNWKPERLDIEAFAKQDGAVQGEWPAGSLARWAESNLTDPDLAPVRWQLQGERREPLGGKPEIWLHLQAQAQAHLSCQRCLQPAAFPLEIERSFRFVQDEATALAEDADAEEDLLVLSRSFDARELIEDELLLALPLVPMHEDCEHPAQGSVDVEALPEEAERPNPFAVLASLRKGEGE
ncbi:DUF177 domain-containing protein [Inhella sp.]|uniref:YceD family protein n=1 Tax=Inhella sp. TaxID=1921806 RepID=UPI0035B20527